MSHLVSRILLSIFLLPLAVICYALTMGIGEWATRGSQSYSRNEIAMFTVADIVTWTAVALYWWLLWRSSIQWTSRRKGGTLVVAVVAALVGAMIALLIGGVTSNGSDIAIFVVSLGGILAILFWLIATVFLWRETKVERAARVSSSSKSAITCPTCGYNLTGLGEARCPECGSKFTLDELLASQPNPAADME